MQATDNGTTKAEDRKLATLVRDLREGTFALAAVDPISATAPKGTQARRIAAYNTLMDLARPGEDKYCGSTGSVTGPCVLKEGHGVPRFDDGAYHMDVEQRDRALRYLIHSNPDGDRRA